MLTFLWMGLIAVILIGGYLYWRFGKMLRFWGLDGCKWYQRVLRMGLALVLALPCINVWSTWAVVVLMSVGVFAVVDIGAFLLRKIFRISSYKDQSEEKKSDGKAFNNKRFPRGYHVLQGLHQSGALALALTAVILGYGFLNMRQIHRTEYTVSSDTLQQEYKIALLTDIHYATIQPTELLTEMVEELNQESPDLVILGGDIVEEGTSNQAMQEVFARLGGLNTRYGIYYVYGNHDRQPYTGNRTYTDKELEEAITSNGIQILEDSYVEINQDLVLAGRDDAGWRNSSGRLSVDEILKDVDRDKFIITADHQPIAVEEESQAGVNLEVSGHTHAGQVWPVGILSELTGVLNYGEYQKGNTQVIVSSGVAGWGYPIRTEGHCEYVVINLK
ncbi:MAG: metallophosphoesterase [Lachnospiraceae bacterium]|nr:metallophosphoesterase [Lachnospiraceae bacterium]